MRAVSLSSRGLAFDPAYGETPRPDSIRIRPLLAGICETDLQLIQGYMGFQGVLGHEFVGIAETGQYAGQRVVGEINCACGRCAYCEHGLRTHCPHRTVLGILNHDGAFADFVWLPEENLHPIPDSISNAAAVFVEPLAAAFQIPAQLELDLFDQIVLLGDGRLGQLCAQTLRLLGHAPIVIGKHPAKLRRLQELGVQTQLLEETTEEQAYDLAIDCTGSPSGLATACRLVRPRGTIVLKTTTAGEAGPNLALAVIHELQVIGSRCGPFGDAVAALAGGELEVESLITSRFPIEQAEEAFAAAQRKDQLKVLLEISG